MIIFLKKSFCWHFLVEGKVAEHVNVQRAANAH